MYAAAVIVIIILLAYVLLRRQPDSQQVQPPVVQWLRVPIPAAIPADPQAVSIRGNDIEHFDTFRNVDAIAEDWRGARYLNTGTAVGAPSSTVACNNTPSRPCNGAAPQLDAKLRNSIINTYTWSERDEFGDNIYDKVYQQVLADNTEGGTEYTAGDMMGMYSRAPVVYFNGERITLAQKA